MLRDGTDTGDSSSEMFSALVHSSPDHFAIVEREDRAKFPTQAFPEFRAGSESEGFQPNSEERAKLIEAINGVFKTGEAARLRMTVRVDGESHWYSTGLTPIRSGGEVARVGLVTINITESMQAQEALVRERRSLKAMERVNVAILTAESVDGMLEDVLELLLDIFECDRAYLLFPCDPNSPTFRVPMERTRPAWPGAAKMGVEIPANDFSNEVFSRALAQPGALRNDPESNPIVPDEPMMESFHVLSQMAMAIHPRSGSAWCFGIHHCERAHVYVQDQALFEAIGRRIADGLSSLLAQELLRESEERFRILVEQAPDALMIFDADTGRFTELNQNAVRLFGYPREELIKLGPRQTSPEFQPNGVSSEESIRVHVNRAASGEAVVFEWQHVNARGEEFPCEVRLVRIPDPNRMLLRGSVSNITERKQSERERERLAEQLQQAQKMEAIGQLTGGVAHDFNNLLTVIMGNLEFVREDVEPASDAEDSVDQALHATRHAASLTQRLLAFSRKQALQPRAVDLCELVNGMEQLLRRTLGETIDISLALEEDLWHCEVDPVQLESAVLNLAINARDAMPGGGRLVIGAANCELDAGSASVFEGVEPGPYVELFVADTGTGMSMSVQRHAFDPFFTTKDVGQGSGLGLSMVYGFVKQSGGTVRIVSELGEGSCLKILLPRAVGELNEDDSVGGQPKGIGGNGELILIVEDDPAVCALSDRLLKRLGYRTMAVANAKDALAVLEGTPETTLLFSDVVLPGGMNGVELARRACEMRPDLKVLFTSGYSERAMLEDGRLDPAFTLINKPFTASALATSVSAILER